MKQHPESNRSIHLNEKELLRLPQFKGVEPTKVSEMLNLATLRRVKEGEHLFETGDPAEEFFLLVEGYARLSRTTEHGEQLVLHHVTPGTLFGITKITENQSYSVSAKAATHCVIVAWRAEHWDKIVEISPCFAREAKRTLGIRMRELADKAVGLATRSVEQRIALTLLQLTEQAGTQTDAGTEIAFPITRQDIAESTGANMHSVSRIMSTWQREKIVSGSRRKVVVLQPKALSQLT